MFNPGPHFGLGAVFRALDLIDNTTVAVAAIDEILGLWCVLPDHRPLTAVSLVTPHTGLLPMQQIGQHRAVGDIGWRRHHRVDQFGAAVDPKMRLHPEIPLIAFLRLMHLGIARLGGILGGRLSHRRSCRWPLSVPSPPSAVAPRRTAAGPDRAPRADDGSG